MLDLHVEVLVETQGVLLLNGYVNKACNRILQIQANPKAFFCAFRQPQC